MPSAVVISHVDFEDLGTLRKELLRAEFRIDYLDFCSSDLRRADPLKPDLLIVLGGPIGVYERGAYPFIDDEVAW